MEHDSMIDNAPMAEGYGHSFTRRNWIRRSRTAKGRHRFLKARRNAEAVADRIVKSGIVDSEALDELMLELEQQTVASEKEKGNRKGRKARLNALEERADFEE